MCVRVHMSSNSSNSETRYYWSYYSDECVSGRTSVRLSTVARRLFLFWSFSYLNFLNLVRVAAETVPDFLEPSWRKPVPHFLTLVLLNARNRNFMCMREKRHTRPSGSAKFLVLGAERAASARCLMPPRRMQRRNR